MELFSGMGSEKDQLLIKTKHSKIKLWPRGPRPEQNRFCRDLQELCGCRPRCPAERGSQARPGWGSVGQRVAVKNDHGLPMQRNRCESGTGQGRTWLIRGPRAGPKCSRADLGDGGLGLAGCLLPGPTRRAQVGHPVREAAGDPRNLRAGWDMKGRRGCSHVNNLGDVVSETS